MPRNPFGAALAVALCACASAPRPTEASRQIRADAPATVEGRVRDADGRPVAGSGVRGIPRGRDIPWLPATTTNAAGSLRLRLAAPAAAGLSWIWRGRV